MKEVGHEATLLTRGPYELNSDANVFPLKPNSNKQNDERRISIIEFALTGV